VLVGEAVPVGVVVAGGVLVGVFVAVGVAEPPSPTTAPAASSPSTT
jgi:hypothetical protein